jgi:hypothetical protein
MSKCLPTSEIGFREPPIRAELTSGVTKQVTPQRFITTIPIERLPFRLLPPGTWSMQDVIDHYRRCSAQLPADLKDRYDESRLKLIELLRPLKCYVGTRMWSGYVLFEFEHNTSLLEHPYRGNAIYVLSGNWKEMVHRTKAEIRVEFAGRYIRIYHVGDWLPRIRAALRQAALHAVDRQA